MKHVHRQNFDRFAMAYLDQMKKPIVRYEGNDLTNKQKRALGTSLIEDQSIEEEIPEKERTPDGPTTRKKLVYQQTKPHPVMCAEEGGVGGLVKNKTGQWEYKPELALGRHLRTLEDVLSVPWIAHVDRKYKDRPLFKGGNLAMIFHDSSRDLGGITSNEYRDEDGNIKKHDALRLFRRAFARRGLRHSMGMKRGLDDVAITENLNRKINGPTSDGSLNAPDALNAFFKTALETGSPDSTDPYYKKIVEESANGNWVFDPTLESKIKSNDSPMSSMVDVRPLKELAQGRLGGKQSADPRLGDLVRQHLLPEFDNVEGRMKLLPSAHNLKTHFERVRGVISDFARIKKQDNFNGETKKSVRPEKQGWSLGVYANPIEQAQSSIGTSTGLDRIDNIDNLLKAIEAQKSQNQAPEEE
jgi:hypothetical protein